jgi:hypothetical protein
MSVAKSSTLPAEDRIITLEEAPDDDTPAHRSAMFHALMKGPFSMFSFNVILPFLYIFFSSFRT